MSVAFELACVKPEDVNAIVSENREKEKESENRRTEVVDANSPENDAGSTLVKGFEPSTCLCPSCLLFSAFSPFATGDLLLIVS